MMEAEGSRWMVQARDWFQKTHFLHHEGLELREYQVRSAWKSKDTNTLVVLPTGLGKTIVAVLHVACMLHRHEKNRCNQEGDARRGINDHDRGIPAPIIIMVAPTRALLVQHQVTFRKWLALSPDRILIVDGSISPTTRKAMYESFGDQAWMLFMTPQTLHNDFLAGRFPLDLIGGLILDEAHHARDQHSYVKIHHYLHSRGHDPRLLAMTASPGHDAEEIQELCNTLNIDPVNAIFKCRDDADVQPYVHDIHVERIGVVLPKEYMQVLGSLMETLSEQVNWLVIAGVLDNSPIDKEMQWKKPVSRMFFINLLEEYRDLPGENHPLKFKIISRLASCIKVHHAIELVEMEGLEAFIDFHHSMRDSLRKKPTKASKRLLENPSFKKAVEIARTFLNDSDPRVACHPKLAVLGRELERFTGMHPGSKVLVFAKFRASVRMIVSHLSEIDGIVAHRFVGQSNRTKHDRGLSRQDQEEVLDKFRSGEFSVLVATSVAEEGLDITECDLVVFYEMVASVITFIQRMGRTGRKRDGKVLMLFTEGTMDYFRMRALDGKLARMKDVYCSVRELEAPSTARKTLPIQGYASCKEAVQGLHENGTGMILPYGTATGSVQEQVREQEISHVEPSNQGSGEKKRGALDGKMMKRSLDVRSRSKTGRTTTALDLFFSTARESNPGASHPYRSPAQDNEPSMIAQTPPPSITSLKRWQHGDPIGLNPRCFLHDWLQQVLNEMNIPTITVDEMIPDILIRKDLAACIRSEKQAYQACMDGSIFSNLHEFASMYPNAIFILFRDTVDIVTKRENGILAVEPIILKKWVTRFCDEFGVQVMDIKSMVVLRAIIKDLRLKAIVDAGN